MCGVNPLIGGVLISGGRGTGKSVMAKAVHGLLPPLERIKGNKFNLDPADPSQIDTVTRDELARTGQKFEDLETEVIPTPFVQMPLDVMEDRLIGSVDMEKSIALGRPVFEPGLLAEAHRGVLYIDDLNLVDETISNTLLEALTSGYVKVEREGLSVEHPFRPILIATCNPEEAEVREHLMDRIGICLSADAEPLTQEDREEATLRAVNFGNAPGKFVEKYKEETEAMSTSITFAREYLKDASIVTEQLKYLVESAIRAGVQGSRGEIYAAEVARASAALNGNERVTADDLNLGVKLCIIPRGTQIQAPQDDEMMMEPPPPPPPPPQQEEQDPDQEEDQEDKEEPEPPEPDEDQQDEMPEIPEEFLIDAVGVVLDPDIMKFAEGNQRKGGGGKRGKIYSDVSGRHIKSMIPKKEIQKLDIRATLAQAAPYQKARRARYLKANPDGTKKVFVTQGDARQKKFLKKTGSLVIFVVDASGSMALNRMNAAKGAAIDLLISAYQKRDKVSLITIQGDCANVLLPPTKSITMAKNRLETMPCGGGSPLADSLREAAKVGLDAQKKGEVGEVVVIVISDGRANVPMAKSAGEMKEGDPMPDKKELKEEVLAYARILGNLPGFKTLFLDTENKFVSTGVGKEIAQEARVPN
jgi:magnesium chelatase subunit D